MLARSFGRMQVTRFAPGGYHNIHTDAPTTHKQQVVLRSHSFSAFLSTPVAGGEMIFTRVRSPDASPDAPRYKGTDEECAPKATADIIYLYLYIFIVAL